MLETLFWLHSNVRYLVLLAAVAAIVMAALGWRSPGGGSSGAERGTMAAFVGLLDLQVLLGLVLLALFPFYPALIGHIMMMALAAVAAHVGSVMARKREPARSAAPVRLITVVIALVLVVGGIMAIQRPLL
jgi:hypothetical protein